MIGRYYAMDRDKRWERVQKALDLLLEGKAQYHADTAEQAARDAYERGETDEFIEPTVVGSEAITIQPGDSVLAFNFRPTGCASARAITEKLAPHVARYTTLTEYDEDWDYPVVFPPAAAGDHDRPGHLRRAGWSSCTSPRRRSTRT